MVFTTIFCTAHLTSNLDSDIAIERFLPFLARRPWSNILPRVTRANLARVRGALPIFKLSFSYRMSTAEHLPSGWPFESSHYMSTFRTPQLGYCRHNVQPSSVHRKNNPHAALTDPWQYPDKVMYQHVSKVLKGATQAFSIPHPSTILARFRPRGYDILLSRPNQNFYPYPYIRPRVIF